jgi:hypothetical protein
MINISLSIHVTFFRNTVIILINLFNRVKK